MARASTQTLIESHCIATQQILNILHITGEWVYISVVNLVHFTLTGYWKPHIGY